MGEVLGDDAGSWLVLLGDLVGVLGLGGWLVLLGSLGTRNGDLSASELGVVEEKGGLGSSLLLEGDGGSLGLAGWGDLDLGDFSAEAEEPEREVRLVAVAANEAEDEVNLLLDLLLRGGGGDVLDVNSAGRHDCGCVM